MKLKALAVKAFRHSGGKLRQEVLNDGDGLDLLVSPANKKTWRLRYAFRGKRPEMKIGSYPEFSLDDARKAAAKYRKMAAHNIDPKLEQINAEEKQKMTFEVVAMDWWNTNKIGWQGDHTRKVKNWLKVRAFPVIGSLPMDSVDAGHITEIMLDMSNKDCSPFLSIISRIFGRALALRLTKHNPAQGFPLRDVIPPLPATKHRAAITDPKLLGQLLRDMRDNDTKSYFTSQALRILPYVFMRPGELQQLRWDCVNFDEGLIRLEAADMKKNRVHIVPMASQVQAMFKEVHAVSGYCPYVFPNERNAKKPMSKNVMTNKLRDMGYGGDVCCSHGFRGTASTIMSKMGKDEDIVELCLAHLIGTQTSRSYNHDDKLPERTKMMQDWADYLDALRDGTTVIPINRAA